MRIPHVTLTPALLDWLASRGDGAPLSVVQSGPDILVTRADGSEPADHEQRRVAGILAAHAAEPFTRSPR